MFAIYFVAVILFSMAAVSNAYAKIQVISNYKKELNIKVDGSGVGVGGCDIIVNNNSTNTDDCWCDRLLTLNYVFCAYTTKVGTTADEIIPVKEDSRCPQVSGETLLCDDLKGLGNCFDEKYTCSVDATGLCHCE